MTARVHDGRTKPRIPTVRMVRSLFLMLWVRIGSFHGLEQARPGGLWRRWLEGPLPSADALGDVASTLSTQDLRAELFSQYRILKRNKAIRPLPGGLLVLVLDGHESGASYLRCSEGSLRRTVKTAKGERVQFYYRHVAAMVVHRGGQLLLDIEPQHQGEDEIAAATRLLRRLLRRYPRAFNVVSGDALYLHPGLCHLVVSHGKDFVAVLKNENRDLIADARGLFPLVEPVHWQEGNTHLECWDIEGFTTWSQFGEPVRVVRSVETRRVRRQATKSEVTETTEWLWATSLPQCKVATQGLVHIGHARWTIENQGFNEIVNAWHADHIYKNHPNAIEALCLLLFLAYNLFHTFLTRNLKAVIRAVYTMEFLTEKVRAAFYQGIPLHARARSP